uniref:Uncharacterized protein n=1 Tax=Trypanosoma congolense (strain IL3000) TaxID=1068625 RepID=G0UMF0_TRYCI|nr:hypothetical protein, unlikely [Trypanosoma congolense IL3000]
MTRRVTHFGVFPSLRFHSFSSLRHFALWCALSPHSHTLITALTHKINKIINNSNNHNNKYNKEKERGGERREKKQKKNLRQGPPSPLHHLKPEPSIWSRRIRHARCREGRRRTNTPV